MEKLVFGILGGAIGTYGFVTDWTFRQQEKPKAIEKAGSSSINYSQVRSAIEEILPQPGYDDGLLGPLFVRLAWHAAGTYDPISGNGGTNGSTMRYNAESKDPANAGLQQAQSFLQPIKDKFPGISYADLWVLASYTAIEYMGGPKIPFTAGRTDAKSESECPPNGRLPDATKDAKHIRDVFGRMGFTDREIVALIGGGHTIGRCHKSRSGFDGPWTNSPTTVSNAFFKELLDKDWKERKWDGPKQFEDKSKKLMMLPTDLEIKNDKNFKKWAQLYKDDEPQFQRDFGDVFKRLTELGFVKYI